MKKGGERYVNWGREALDLYEKNLNKVGKIEYRGEFPYTLLPTFHSTANQEAEHLEKKPIPCVII